MNRNNISESICQEISESSVQFGVATAVVMFITGMSVSSRAHQQLQGVMFTALQTQDIRGLIPALHTEKSISRTLYRWTIVISKLFLIVINHGYSNELKAIKGRSQWLQQRRVSVYNSNIYAFAYKSRGDGSGTPIQIKTYSGKKCMLTRHSENISNNHYPQVQSLVSEMGNTFQVNTNFLQFWN